MYQEVICTAAKSKPLEYYEAQLRRISEHREAGAEKEIRNLYKSLLNDLKADLGKLYANNANDDGVIDFSRLRTNGRYAKFLELAQDRLDGVSPAVRKEIRTVVQDTYKEMYNGMVDAVKKATDSEDLAKSLDSIRAVTPETVKQAVQNPISGLTLNETLEKNRQAVIYDIKQTITTGLVVGDHVSTMSKKLTEKVDMDYRKATRIVRTETHRVREAGANDAAVEINDILEKSPHVDVFLVKIWRTKQDKAVRPQTRYKTKKGWKFSYNRRGANHMKMEGQTVKVNEKFDLGGGVTADCPGSSGVAAHDINCRCRAVRELMTAEEFAKATGIPASKIQEKYAKGLEKSDNRGIIELNDDETRALNQYISSDSYKINEKLRNGEKLSQEDEVLVRNLDSALDKMPNYEGNVKRSILLFGFDKSEFDNRYRVGNIVEESFYVSTSTSIYDESMDIQMEITSYTGKDIRVYNPDESEILFRRGTKFIVTDIKNGVIMMRELLDEGK